MRRLALPVLFALGFLAAGGLSATVVAATGTGTTTTGTDTTAPGAQYYVVLSGDTLGSIAGKYRTTVDELMTLNPGIDPTALHIGQKIRVK